MKLRSVISFLLFILCLYILFFQTSWLGILLIKNPEFPLGSLISWFMIADLAYFVKSVSPAELKFKSVKSYRSIINGILVLSIFWGVFSFALSGNWKWVFTDMTNFIIWAVFSTVLVVLNLVIVLILITKKIRNINWFSV